MTTHHLPAAGLGRRLLRRAVARLPRGRARIARLLSRRWREPFIDVVEPHELGLKLGIEPADPFQMEIWLGTYQPHVLAFMRRCVRPGATVLCAGLHVGYIAAVARRLAGPSGLVLSAEPDAAARAWALRNLALADATRDARVEVLAGGLSDTPGALPLYRSAVMGHSSFAAPHQPGGTDVVPVHRGDDWLGGLGVRALDVLVLDVEGWEVHTLRGLASTIAHSTGLRALVEASEWALESAGESRGSLIDFWQARGFTVRWAVRYGRDLSFGVWGPPATAHGPSLAGDLLCVRDGTAG
jgi:FkbM family methyltransferase